MLAVENLQVCYGPIRALKGLSFKVDTGEIVALLGANGAGKSTTLRSISGMMKLAAGSIQFLGRRIDNLKPHEIVRGGISHVPEGRGIFANLTVMENLRLGGYIRKVPESDYDEVFELFKILKERRKQIAGTLSGGEQQMLAISRALIAKPKLLLLDEPSLGLAPQIVKSIMETIKKINHAGTTVLLVEQNAMAALRIATRAYVIEVGEIVLSDSASNLINNDTIRKAYLGED